MSCWITAEEKGGEILVIHFNSFGVDDERVYFIVSLLAVESHGFYFFLHCHHLFYQQFCCPFFIFRQIMQTFQHVYPLLGQSWSIVPKISHQFFLMVVVIFLYILILLLKVIVLFQVEFPHLLQGFLLPQVLEIYVFASLDGLVVSEDGLEHIRVAHSFVHIQRQSYFGYLLLKRFELSSFHGQ